MKQLKFIEDHTIFRIEQSTIFFLLQSLELAGLIKH